jgi:hypothetical protein
MRIRAKVRVHAPVTPEDALWLGDYEKAGAQRRGESFGASQSASRKVSYTEEEHAAQAIGTGSAAEMAAAAAMSREEGRRLDSIVDRGIGALERACNAWEKMTAALLKERQADAQTHRALLESLRSHFLARAEAEGALIKAEADHVANDHAGESLEAQATQALLQRLMKQVSGDEQTDVNSGTGAE